MADNTPSTRIVRFLRRHLFGFAVMHQAILGILCAATIFGPVSSLGPSSTAGPPLLHRLALLWYHASPAVPAAALFLIGASGVWACRKIKRGEPHAARWTVIYILLAAIFVCVQTGTMLILAYHQPAWLANAGIYQLHRTVINAVGIPIDDILATLPAWLLLPAVLVFPSLQKPQSRETGVCQCGYNLTGNVSGICSECGTPIAPGATAGLSASAESSDRQRGV